MTINVNRITSRQKLVIAKGLCDYQYIMDNWQTDDKDFRDIYYDFYLKASWAVMRKPNNWEPYFQELQSINPEDDLMDILHTLKDKTAEKRFEFSLGSKLLHTRNPKSPIYDSKVREYLSKEEGVNFWWQIPIKSSGAPRGISEEEKIKHDWIELCTWYDHFIKSSRGKEWICWFDENYPSFSNISEIKKIDFIIFATN